MGGAIGGSLGYALGIAISPIPIAALLLTLLSARPRTNSVAFTAGWTAGIVGVTTIAAVKPLFEAGDDPSDTRGWIRLTVGVILLAAGIRRWQTRPAPDVERPVPPLMRAIDGAGALGVVGIGFALAAFNPKDLLLAAAGGAEIATAELAAGASIVAIAVFTAIAASTAMIPVAAHLAAGHRLDDRLERSRDWLVRHNAVVIADVLGAVGLLFAVEGLHILRD